VFFVFFIHNDNLNVEARKEFPRLKPYFDWAILRVSLGLIRCRAMVHPISEAEARFQNLSCDYYLLAFLILSS
jgi:hypothetical protein